MLYLGVGGAVSHDRCDTAAHQTGIDPCRVTLDDTLLFESFDAGGDGGLRKSNLLPEFGC
jgi:hypothetical protein